MQAVGPANQARSSRPTVSVRGASLAPSWCGQRWP